MKSGIILLYLKRHVLVLLFVTFKAFTTYFIKIHIGFYFIKIHTGFWC